MNTKAIFISTNLIGDLLNISPALRAWHDAHPDWAIDMLTLDDHATNLYRRMGVPLNVIFEEHGPYNFQFRFDCGDAFTVGEEHHIHQAECYARLLGVEIKTIQPTCIPEEDAWIETQPKMILISPFSRSCASQKGGRANKMLPWAKWQHLLRYVRTLGYPIRVLGAPGDRADLLDFSEEEYLCGLDLNRIALLMRDKAVLLITIDNGMSHLGATQLCPTFLFYPQCLNIEWIVPWGNPHIVPIQMDPVDVSVSGILTYAKAHLPKLIAIRS